MEYFLHELKILLAQKNAVGISGLIFDNKKYFKCIKLVKSFSVPNVKEFWCSDNDFLTYLDIKVNTFYSDLILHGRTGQKLEQIKISYVFDDTDVVHLKILLPFLIDVKEIKRHNGVSDSGHISLDRSIFLKSVTEGYSYDPGLSRNVMNLLHIEMWTQA